MRPRWIWLTFFNVISNSDLNSVCLKYSKDEKGGCWQTNLWMYKGHRWENIWLQAWNACQVFQWSMKSMILDPCSRQNGVNNRLDGLKRCFHHSLRDLCVYTDGAQWKLKSVATKKILITIQICVSFVWSFFLLGVCHHGKRVLIAWCVQFVIIHFCLYIFEILINFLMGVCFVLSCLFCSKQMTQASCFM